MWFFKVRNPKIERRHKIAIRMEAIGGQGANSAGKILAEAAVLGMHYTGNHFSSFGSEKRGSHVRSFVRLSTERNPIRTASSVRHPDLLIVFHESLLISHPECFEGVGEQTDILINSTRKPQDIEVPAGCRLRAIHTINASGLALNYACGINSILLGSASVLIPEVASHILLQTLTHYFAKLSQSVRNQNERGFQAGIKKLTSLPFNARQSRLPAAHSVLPEMGWLNAPLGGVIANPGNSILKENTASRKGIVPRFLKDVCFNCGLCDMVCPDYCFVWANDPAPGTSPTLQGIDYQYCKACQKCIVACPVEALVPVLESELLPEEKNAKLFPGISAEKVEASWRNADWSQMTESLSPTDRMLTVQTELLDPKSYIRPDFSKTHLTKKKTSENT